MRGCCLRLVIVIQDLACQSLRNGRFPGHFRDVRASLERAATRRRSGESLDRSNRCLLGDGDYQLERSALVDFFACDSLHSWPLSPAAAGVEYERWDLERLAARLLGSCRAFARLNLC